MPLVSLEEDFVPLPILYLTMLEGPLLFMIPLQMLKFNLDTGPSHILLPSTLYLAIITFIHRMSDTSTGHQCHLPKRELHSLVLEIND